MDFEVLQKVHVLEQGYLYLKVCGLLSLGLGCCEACAILAVIYPRALLPGGLCWNRATECEG